MNNIKYYSFIYMTTNLINGKKYIGMHKGSETDDYLGSGKLLLKAINKYGKENFKRKILEFSNSKDELEKLEVYYIKKYNAVYDDNFYNIHVGGSGGNTIAGYTSEQKEEYKLKMRESLLNCNNPPYGKPFSEKTKNKIRMKKLQYWENISEEERKNFSEIMSNAVKGEKNPNFGNYWTDEQKQHLSELRIKNGKSKGKLNGMFGKSGENAINGKFIYV